MIIDTIQSIQFLQNLGSPADRGDQGVDAGKTLSPSQASINKGSTEVSPQGIVAGINYIEEQLHTLLTSYPPFFPLGTYQRTDLIKGIRSLEDQIGKSGWDKKLKQIFPREKLSENASDTEISASLSRLYAARNQLKESNPIPAKPGSLLNVSV